MDEHNAIDSPLEPRRGRRHMGLKLAIAGAVTAAVLATSGVAHAGYRWSRMAPATTTTSTTTTTVTTSPQPAGAYRWG